MKEVLRYSNCFVCGENNHYGLKAKFYYDTDKAFTEIVTDSRFEGYKGIYHGGIVASLLDEVMIKAILAKDIYTVTREMTVKYLKPVKIGEKLTFTGKIVKSKSGLYLTEGEVRDASNNLLAKAAGKYIEAADNLKIKLLNSID